MQPPEVPHFPTFCCILGPRGCGKTALAVRFASDFLDVREQQTTQIYIYTHNDEVEYKDVVRGGAVQFRKSFFGTEDSKTMFPAATYKTCMLLIDVGFLNHAQQVALREWMDVHPSASVILCEYLWPEPQLAQGVQLTCEWEREAPPGERGGGFIFYSGQASPKQAAAESVDDSSSSSSRFLFNSIHSLTSRWWVALEDLMSRHSHHLDIEIDIYAILAAYIGPFILF